MGPEAIVAFISAFPKLVTLFEKLGPELVNIAKGLKKYIDHISGNDADGMIKRVGGAFAKLNDAKTDKERQAAAEAIAKAVRGL